MILTPEQAEEREIKRIVKQRKLLKLQQELHIEQGKYISNKLSELNCQIKEHQDYIVKLKKLEKGGNNA